MGNPLNESLGVSEVVLQVPLPCVYEADIEITYFSYH